MQLQASATPPSWILYYMLPRRVALGLALGIFILTIPAAYHLNETKPDKSEQRPRSEKCPGSEKRHGYEKRHTTQDTVSATELATLAAGTVREKLPKGGQFPREAKLPEKIKPQKDKARKRKAILQQQDKQVQSGIILEPGMPKEDLAMTGKLTTASATVGSKKSKAASQYHHSSDMPKKEVSNIAIESAQSTSEKKITAASPPRLPLGPPGKEATKSRGKPHASRMDLAKEHTKMKNQPYPRVKIEEDAEESKRYAEWAVRSVTGKRMFAFTDGGSCAQASSAAFTYTCLPERQVQRRGRWNDESYGIIGDIQSREAEMIALTKALEAVEMETKRQAVSPESPLRAFVFTDSRDILRFCKTILANGKTYDASRNLARDNVSRALGRMINRMRSMNSTVKLELHWVKGHSSIHHNKRADSLATSALHAVKEYMRYTRHETARDSRGYDLIPSTDMTEQSKEVIAQRAPDIGQELQKEMRVATQQQIDTMVAFQAKLEAQARAVEPMMGYLNRFAVINDSGFIDLHPETVAVISQHSPRGTKVPKFSPIDGASVVRSQTPEQDAQGITMRKQGGPGESPEQMGQGKTEETADKNIALKGLCRRRQAALMFLRIGKSLRTWFR